jgi:hypothetical protein
VGRSGKTGVELVGATLIWLRHGKIVPESMFFRAPESEPSKKCPFGRAPAEAGCWSHGRSPPKEALSLAVL